MSFWDIHGLLIIKTIVCTLALVGVLTIMKRIFRKR